MKKLLFILQFILKIFLIFVFFFIWTRYFIKELWLSILTAAGATILIEIITRLAGRKKSNSASLKVKEKEEAENMFLSLSSNPSAFSFFEKLAKIKHPSVAKKTKYIVISHSEKTKTILYPYLYFKPLSIDDLSEIIEKTEKEKATKLVISCGECSKEAYSFAKNFDIKIVILDRFETYKKLYKEYDCFPEITRQYKKDKALAFKDLLAYSFNKNRTKGYFLSALIIFLAGFLVRANLYYSIMASILVIFAFISQFNWVFNKSEGELL